MNNTESFFEAFKNFREEMREIQTDERAQLKRVDAFQDSVNYEERKAQIEKRFEAEREKVRQKAREGFTDSVELMKSRLERLEPLEPPSPEQERVIRALRALDTVPPEMLDSAAATVAGNALAMHAFNEICRKNGAHTKQISVKNDRKAAQESIKSLERFARIVLEMPRVDHREQYAKSPLYHKDAYPAESNRVSWLTNDRDFDNAPELISWAGNVTDVDAFSKLVNS